MLKKKRRSENDLINIYYNCVLFKKYYQYNLWFGNFGEYDSIKYCKTYIQKYIYIWIHIFLLQRFSLSFVIFLYKSPCFTKFVESGIFKYLNYHFLLSFYNNCFTFDLKGKQKIKFFVKSYFQIFLKKHLEKDILILVIKVINEIILNALIHNLINRLKSLQISVERVWLNDILLFKLITIEKNYCKSLLKSISFKDNKILRTNLRSSKISKLTIEKTFIGFPQIYIYRPNKNVEHLVESVEFLGGFNGQEKNIGLYKNSSILFEDSLIQNYLIFNKLFKTFKLFLKSFNFCFFKCQYKRKFFSKFLVKMNLKFFNKDLKKNFKSNFLKLKKKSIVKKKKLLKIIKKRFLIKYKSSLMKNNKTFNNTFYSCNICLFYKTNRYYKDGLNTFQYHLINFFSLN